MADLGRVREFDTFTLEFAHVPEEMLPELPLARRGVFIGKTSPEVEQSHPKPTRKQSIASTETADWWGGAEALSRSRSDAHAGEGYLQHLQAITEA